MNTPSKRSVLHTRTIYESPNLLADLEPTLLGAELGKPSSTSLARARRRCA